MWCASSSRGSPEVARGAGGRRCVGTDRYGSDAYGDGRIEGDMNQATPAGAVEADRAGDQARPRVLQLVHFLAEYDSLRNPPVRAVPAYGLYDLRSAALPSAPGVRLLPPGVTDETGDVWLTVDFV